MKPVRKAVLPVAGFGTRMLPAAKSVPKEMLPVWNRPAIHYVVAEAKAAGIDHIVLVTGRGKSSLEDYFDHASELENLLQSKGKTEALNALMADLPEAGKLSYVRQMEPLGLGHAVWCARDIIGQDPFVVLLPDVILDDAASCLTRMITAYETTGGNIIAVEEVALNDVEKYGIIKPVSHPLSQPLGQPGNDLIPIESVIEKPSQDQAPSRLAVLGRYLLQPEIFDILSTQQKGAGGEIQLTDAMANLMRDQSFYALPFEGKSYDCGDRLSWFKANLAFGLKDKDLGKDLRHQVLSIIEQQL